MHKSTRRILLEINRRFYDEYARSFGNTRSRPWQAWPCLLTNFSATHPQVSTPLRVLDAGCGNGRFGRLVAETVDRPVIYHGWDQSLGLLEQARDKVAGHVAGSAFHAVDLGSMAPEAWPEPEEPFQIIGIFGVLHHLPGEAERRRLLSALGQRLAPGGELWASWWMLHHTERFKKKVRNWEEVPQVYKGLEPPNLDHLEPGDRLLAWQKDGLGLRYLHFPPEDELERLKHLPGLTFSGELMSDGPTGRENLYLKWQRQHDPSFL